MSALKVFGGLLAMIGAMTVSAKAQEPMAMPEPTEAFHEVLSGHYVSVEMDGTPGPLTEAIAKCDKPWIPENPFLTNDTILLNQYPETRAFKGEMQFERHDDGYLVGSSYLGRHVDKYELVGAGSRNGMVLFQLRWTHQQVDGRLQRTGGRSFHMLAMTGTQMPDGSPGLLARFPLDPSTGAAVWDTQTFVRCGEPPV